MELSSTRQAKLRQVFASHLTLSGKRLTPERLHILETAMGMKSHFGVTQLQAALEAGSLRVSRATVFNTLPLLVGCGVLRRYGGSRRSDVVYELAGERESEPRVRLVCTDCGKVYRRKAPAGLLEWVEAQSWRDFTVDAPLAELSLSGLCNRCRRSRRQKRTLPSRLKI